MNQSTLSILFDVFAEIGTAALILGACGLWVWRLVRRHPEYRNDR